MLQHLVPYLLPGLILILLAVFAWRTGERSARMVAMMDDNAKTARDIARQLERIAIALETGRK
jgi:hypothetical protein